MAKDKHGGDPLEAVLREIEDRIQKEFGTFEKFAYSSDVNKSTLSRLLAERKDCKVSTLRAIAKGLGKKLVIKLQ